MDFSPGKHIHFIGIGGVGMAGLAYMLHQKGCIISGSDIEENHWTQKLRSLGVRCFIGHNARHLSPEVAGVIQTPAIAPTNPEWQEAIARSIPISKRGEILARLVNQRYGVAVSGTHGKTTTTALLVHALEVCKVNPGYFVGAAMPQKTWCARLGDDDVLVVEADESDKSLLYYKPSFGIITNIEFDHPEHYESDHEYRACFAQFVRQSTRCLIEETAWDQQQGGLCYGFSEKADVQAFDLVQKPAGISFSIRYKGANAGRFFLPLRGRHNVLNATAAIGFLLEHKIPYSEDLFKAFKGVARRFEVLSQAPFVVISDYAHHPTEIQCLMNATRQAYPDRPVYALFQPHRFSRTQALLNEFATAFEGVHLLGLCPVYAASEPVRSTGTSQVLAEAMYKQASFGVEELVSLDDAAYWVRKKIPEGSVLLVIGAGDVDRVARGIAERHRRLWV